ncbi:hypothetical protein BSKO_06492 [Bryopsis sp. KO-2023]|nr:hypothetical protein BSKO_06492 [Bryopsis sp. KO-2023]
MRQIAEIVEGLQLENALLLGDEKNIVWGKMRGYCAWPAQVLSKEAAEAMLKPVKGTSSLPLMFFGRREVAWLPQANVSNWSVGCKKVSTQMSKEADKRRDQIKGFRAQLYNAVEQALDYIINDQAPEEWWERMHDDTTDEEEVDPEAQSGGNAFLAACRFYEDANTGHVLSGEDSNEPVQCTGQDAFSPGAPPAATPQAGDAPEWWSQKSNRTTGPVAGIREEDLLCREMLWPKEATRPRNRNRVARIRDFQAKDVRPASLRRDGSGTSGGSSQCDGSRTGNVEERMSAEQILQRRLTEYKSTNESIWTNRHRRPKLLNEGDVEKCNCTAETGSCDEGCILRAVQTRCDPRVCPCKDACQNMPFDFLRRPEVEPFMTTDKGIGIKAMENIREGSFIIEYTGEVIDKGELKQRFEKTKNAPGQYMDYYMQLQTGLWLDARNQGNLSRFINSSCQPNCLAERYTDASNNQQRIGIFAKCDIKAGTELTYDYLMEPIHQERYSAHLECRCGARNCRGVTLKTGSRPGSGSWRRKRRRRQLEEIDTGNDPLGTTSHHAASQRRPSGAANHCTPSSTSMRKSVPATGSSAPIDKTLFLRTSSAGLDGEWNSSGFQSNLLPHSGKSAEEVWQEARLAAIERDAMQVETGTPTLDIRRSGRVAKQTERYGAWLAEEEETDIQIEKPKRAKLSR